MENDNDLIRREAASRVVRRAHALAEAIWGTPRQDCEPASIECLAHAAMDTKEILG